MRQACCPPAEPKQFKAYAADIVAALDGNLLDRRRHDLGGNADVVVGDGLGALARPHLVREFGEGRLNGGGIDWAHFRPRRTAPENIRA